MPIHSIEPRRLYRQIADQIRSADSLGRVCGGLAPAAGARPCEQLGVSRPSVREALIALEVEGLVDVRIGSGIYVLDRGTAMAATMRCRRPRARSSCCARAGVIEGECAALAAKSAKKAQLAAIEEALDVDAAGDARIEQAAARTRTACFTCASPRRTGNGALVQVVKMLWEERAGPLYKQLEHHYDAPELWDAAIAEHRAVLKAIAAHDPAAARAARCSVT